MTGWDELFDIGIATIFTRELLEASIIIGQFRRVVIRSEALTPTEKNRALLNIWISAGLATLCALIIIVGFSVPLGILGNELDDRVSEIIEGVSKLVAAICIAQLSLKIPTWLGVYPSKKDDPKINVSLRELRFNVAWNIWREVAEIGVFLLPFFINGGAIAIPVSGLIGALIAVIPGGGIYLANKYTNGQKVLAFSMAFITGWLSVGLFTGGCHEFEEVLGETETVFEIHGDFWDAKKFPMTIFKPFGYSDHPSVLMVCAFWLWAALLVGLHIFKYFWTHRAARKRELEKDLQSQTEAGCYADDNNNTTTTFDNNENKKDFAALNQIPTNNNSNTNSNVIQSYGVLDIENESDAD